MSDNTNYPVIDVFNNRPGFLGWVYPSRACHLDTFRVYWNHVHIANNVGA